MNDRLYRSVDDRVIAGVCGGLAVRMGVDPSLVRIGYAIVALLTGVFPLLVLYVIMAVVVPEEPTGFAGIGRPAAPPGPGAVPGWTPPGGGAAWPAAGETPPASWAPPAPDVAEMPEVGEGEAGVAPATAPPGPSPAPGWPPPEWPPAPAAPAWSQPAPRRRRAGEGGDPLLAAVGGLVLVGLGVYFLVRDRITVDWSVVGAAGLMALGLVVIVAAFRRHS